MATFVKKAKAAECTPILTIGGWTGSATLSDLVADESTRDAFAKLLVEAVEVSDHSRCRGFALTPSVHRRMASKVRCGRLPRDAAADVQGAHSIGHRLVGASMWRRQMHLLTVLCVQGVPWVGQWRLWQCLV